ncbi:MAG: hypothetical protein ABH842_03195 [Candidatus Micrarchaeota archaeon]
MKIFNILIGVIVILILILGGIVAYVLTFEQLDQTIQTLPPTFAILETGIAGSYGYAVYNYRGTGNLSILSYEKMPQKSIVIINDSQAIQTTRFSEFVDELKSLENYGYTVTVTDEPKVGDGIYVVPSGALPSYVLFNLQQGSSNGTILYLGAKNLILSTGIKENSWYAQLTPEQKERIVIYDGTLDQFLEDGKSIYADLLYNNWLIKGNDTINLSGNGIQSSIVSLPSSGYVRVIYNIGDLQGAYDSPYLTKSQKTIPITPSSIYPWEKASSQFELNKTTGTAVLTIRKDGDVVESRELRKVTDQNIFIQTFEYDEPGEYILSIDDNSGNIASGLLHIKDIKIIPVSSLGNSYTFSITVDGKPLTNAETEVWLGNSTIKKKFYVTAGEVVVNAQLDPGSNIFNFEIHGKTITVVVTNNKENLFEFYIKYGIPGLIIVIIVYFGVRMTKKPTYRLRFGDSSTYIRQEIKLPRDRAIESFKKVRHDMHLSKSPITPHEFTVSLKRYLTNGADVTEGNVEEILSKLVKTGYLETHRDYYQLKGEGDVKLNVLHRIIREKLIESGTPFKEQENKFILKNMEIGFFNHKFDKKAIIVVDDENEIKQFLASVDENHQARLRIAQTNGMLSFVTIDKLSGLL